jgi:hypothetical protein
MIEICPASGTYQTWSPSTYVNALSIPAEPRFTGNGLLIEAAGTNSCLQSRTVTTSPWGQDNTPIKTQDQIGIDGVANTAWTIEDDDASSHEGIKQTITVPDDSNTHVFSVFIKKDSNTSRFPELQMTLTGGTTKSTYGQVNTSTGATLKRIGSGTITSVSEGDWWRVIVNVTNNGTGNTSLTVKVFPAITTSLGSIEATTTGSIIVDQAQVELNQSFASSPIITTTVAVTRATEAGVADTSGAQWTLNTALTNMLAETLGSDLVTNGTFAADSDWNKGTGWSIAAGVASCDGTQIATTVLYQLSVTSGLASDLYKVTMDVTRSAGTWQVYLGSSGWDDDDARSGYSSNTGTLTYYLRPDPAGGSPETVNFAGDSSFVGTVDNIVVKEVTNDSRGTMVVDWTPGVDSDDVSENNQGLISMTTATRWVYQRADTETINMWDGASTTTKTTFDYTANTTYRIIARWGIDSSNVRQMDVSYIVSGSVASSSLKDYDGAFALSEMVLALLGTWPQCFKNIKFFDTVLTDAEIEAL